MLKAMNSKGEQLGNVDFIEAEWDRKWSATGEFMLYLALDEYMRLNALDVKYILNVGRPETGVIQKTEYENKTSGSFVTLSGYFVENFLDFTASRRSAVISAESAEEVRQQFESYITIANAAVDTGTESYKPLGSVTIDDESVFPSEIDTIIQNGLSAGEGIYSALSGTGYGILANVSQYPADETGELSLNVLFRIGREKTQGDEAVYFGKAYNNASDVKYTLDESAERCIYEAFIMVEEDKYSSFKAKYFPIKFTETVNGEAQYYIGTTYVFPTNQPTGLGATWPKKVLEAQLDSQDVDLTVTTDKNQQKIENLLKKEAQLDMLDNYKVETISVDVIQERFIYLKDYDLGDMCVVDIDDMEAQYKARIEEIQERHRQNKIEVKLVLGTPVKQKYRR